MPWGIRLSRQKHHWPANSVFVIGLVSRNTSPRSDTLPDNTICFLGVDNFKITKNVLPHLKLSRIIQKCKKLLVQSISKANSSVRRLQRSNVKSSKTINLAQLCLCLDNIIIQRIDKVRKIKLKTVKTLEDITGRIW